MKIPLLVLAAVHVSTAAAASAQRPPNVTAATALAKVQKHYAVARHLTAQFRQIVTNATFTTTKTSDGTMMLARPGKVRWDYLQKQGTAVRADKSFVFDGTTVWVLDHGNKQIVKDTVGNHPTLPAAVAFLTGGNLATQFTVTLRTGSGPVMLDLVPKQAATYKQVSFIVDPTDWHVVQSEVVGAGGDTNTFKFYGQDAKAPSKASWFQVLPAAMPTYKLVVVGASTATPKAPPSATSSPTP